MSDKSEDFDQDPIDESENSADLSAIDRPVRRRKRKKSTTNSADAKVESTSAEVSEDTETIVDGADKSKSVTEPEDLVPQGKRTARRQVANRIDSSKVAVDNKKLDKKSPQTGFSKFLSVLVRPFRTVIVFFQEVIQELRKVIWPSRAQMVGYTSVVLIFIVFMVAFISGLDIGFAKGILKILG